MRGFDSVHVTGTQAWPALCDQALARLSAHSEGELAFVYLAEELAADAQKIVDHLRDTSGIPHWVGCVGMGLCSTGRESYATPGMAIMTTPFTRKQFSVIPALERDSDIAAWLAGNRAWRESSLASVAVVHGDPGSRMLPDMLVTLSDGLQGGFLVGGIASAEQGPVQIADRVITAGLSGVLFSGEIGIGTGLSQGCSLIGRRHRVTRGRQNIIETIDDRPALEVFKEDIGEVLAHDLRRVGGYIFAALPITGSDTGDYLVRNLVGLDPERGLLAIGDTVLPGMEIQFARRDADTAGEDLVRMVSALLERMPSSPSAALYHSCLGRGRNLFGADSAELRIIQDLLGEIPLVGFYANGEISHHRLYGYTGVLTLFS